MKRRDPALANSLLVRIVRPPAAWAMSPKVSWARRRKRADLLTRAIPMPRWVTIEHAQVGGVPCEILTPAHADPDMALLYLHGGGFTVGSPRSHRHMVARLARSMSATAWVIDYRLAPEHPFPAGLEDCLAAYRDLVGREITRIVVAGDSAGGGLTLSLALGASTEGLPAPAALGLISPALDLTIQAEAQLVENPRDLLRIRFLRPMFDAYVAETPRDHRLISPLHADLTGFHRS